MFESLTRKREAGNGELLFAADGADHRRARAWLDAQLRRMKKERFFVPDHMTTPALAEVVLAINTRNRRVRSAGVTRLARAMSAGRYLATPVPVIICGDGIVIDGQHRLSAVIEAGVPAPLTFAFGWPYDIFKVLDTGIVRNGGDILSIHGEEWSDQLAASLRKLTVTQGSQPRSNARVDNDELLDILADNPEMRLSCPVGGRIYRALKVSPTAITVAHYLITRDPNNREKAEIFFDKLGSGLGLTSKRDPIYQLRKFLQEGDFRGKAGTAATVITASTIKAFNAFKAGRKVTMQKVEWLKDEPFPEVE